MTSRRRAAYPRDGRVLLEVAEHLFGSHAADVERLILTLIVETLGETPASAVALAEDQLQGSPQRGMARTNTPRF